MFSRNQSLRLGTRRLFPLRRYVTLNERLRRSHKHIQGISGSGKSSLLCQNFADLLLNCNIAACLIDPHGDLAEDTLALLADRGYFQRPDAYEKLWYIDFTRSDYFVPFNILSQPYSHTTTASHLIESFERAYPQLADGAAPQFENVLQFTAVVLKSNNLPITKAEECLTLSDYREALLQNTTHEPTLSFFHNRYDQWGKDQVKDRESTLNKVSNLTFTDAMRFSLGQSKNLLDFPRIFREGISLIINIHLDNKRAQRLLGCLLTSFAEAAALTRKKDERTEYHCIIDEAFSFSTSRGEAFSDLLSQARKFKFYLWLAHQTWDQIPETLRTAVQNMIVEIYFGLGYDDSQLIAPRIHRFDPSKTKSAERPGSDTPQPLTGFSLMYEQWEELGRELENLNPQEAYVKIKRMLPRWKQFFMQPLKTMKMRTLTLPNRRCSKEQLTRIQDDYAKLLLTPRHELQSQAPQPSPIFTKRSRFGSVS